MGRKIIGIGALIIVLAIAVCGYLMTRQSAPRQMPTSPESVAAAERRLNAALSPAPLPAKTAARKAVVDAVKLPSPLSRPPLRTVSIAEEDVNAVLAGSAQVVTELSNKGIYDAQVKFLSPNRVDVYGMISRGSAKQDITVHGTLTSTIGGGLSYIPNSLLLGDLPAPESPFDTLIRKESARIIKAGLPHIPLNITKVEIENHELTLTGKPK